MKLYTFSLWLLICFPLFGHTTGICIFDDTGDPKSWEKAAIKQEFTKTLHESPEHLFITPRLWRAYKKKFNKTDYADAFCKQYTLYNTHIGLLYIRHNNAPENMGIAYKKYSLIPSPFDIHAGKNIKTNKWTKKFNTLFDLPTWHNYHKQIGHKSFIYMNGHGTETACHLNCAMAAGIPGAHFAHLLQFFNEELKINTFGMQSCFWTSKRILKTMKQHFGYKQLHFNILTPLKSEKELWLTNFESCDCLECREDPECTFYDGLQRATDIFNGAITQKLKNCIKKIDTLNIPKKRHQSATLIAAETQHVLHI